MKEHNNTNETKNENTQEKDKSLCDSNFTNDSEEMVEDLQNEEILKLQENIKVLEDKYLRANADFENIKKRLEKEKYQAVDYANEVFARDLLSIVDALEIAYKTSCENESNEIMKKISEGIALTLEQFKKVFEKHGIQAINDSGEFNPNIHDAMMRVDSKDTESGQIVQCFQKGYMIKDRVLRPAMVSVAK